MSLFVSSPEIIWEADVGILLSPSAVFGVQRERSLVAGAFTMMHACAESPGVEAVETFAILQPGSNVAIGKPLIM